MALPPDSLISMQTKIRRRLKWKLLLQDIENESVSSSDTIVPIENIDNFILETQNAPKNTVKTKKRICLHTRNRTKMKIKKRANKLHSKSFIPEVLCKENEFDVTIATYNDVECIMHNLIDNSDGSKIKPIKDSLQKHEVFHRRVGRNNFNITCPGFGEECKSELSSFYKKNDTIQKQINESKTNVNNILQKHKKQKKSLYEIVEDLKQSSSDRSSITSILTENSQNLGGSVDNVFHDHRETITRDKTKEKRQGKDNYQLATIRENNNLNKMKNQKQENKSPKLSNSPREILKCESTSKKEQEPNLFKKPLNKNKKAIHNTENELQVPPSNSSNHNNNTDITSNKTRGLIESLLQSVAFNNTNCKFNLKNLNYEICLSRIDKKYIYLYAKSASILNQYNDLLKIVDFVEQQCPGLTKYILGMRILETIGAHDNPKYMKLFTNLKKEIETISKVLQRGCFEEYKEYALWLFEKRRKM